MRRYNFTQGEIDWIVAMRKYDYTNTKILKILRKSERFKEISISTIIKILKKVLKEDYHSYKTFYNFTKGEKLWIVAMHNYGYSLEKIKIVLRKHKRFESIHWMTIRNILIEEMGELYKSNTIYKIFQREIDWIVAMLRYGYNLKQIRDRLRSVKKFKKISFNKIRNLLLDEIKEEYYDYIEYRPKKKVYVDKRRTKYKDKIKAIKEEVKDKELTSGLACKLMKYDQIIEMIEKEKLYLDQTHKSNLYNCVKLICRKLNQQNIDRANNIILATSLWLTSDLSQDEASELCGSTPTSLRKLIKLFNLYWVKEKIKKLRLKEEGTQYHCQICRKNYQNEDFVISFPKNYIDSKCLECDIYRKIRKIDEAK